MPKTRRTKRNVNPPVTGQIILATAEETIKGHNGQKRNRTVTVLTGAPRGKVYPYGSGRQGYGAAPRVARRPVPVLDVMADGTISEAR